MAGTLGNVPIASFVFLLIDFLPSAMIQCVYLSSSTGRLYTVRAVVAGAAAYSLAYELQT